MNEFVLAKNSKSDRLRCKECDRFSSNYIPQGGIILINYILDGGAKKRILGLTQPQENRLNSVGGLA